MSDIIIKKYIIIIIYNKQKQRMQEFVDTLTHLQSIKPVIRGTTLITYIVPGDMDIWLLNKHLTKEISVTGNVKSKHVRTSVVSALKALNGSINISCIKGKTPPNGLVMLAGKIQTDNLDVINQYV